MDEHVQHSGTGKQRSQARSGSMEGGGSSSSDDYATRSCDHACGPQQPAESMTDANTGGALPLVNCACIGCTWSLHLRDMPEDRGDDNTPAVEQTFRHHEEHPCDQLLRKHILEVHSSEITNLIQPIFENSSFALHIWDIYKEALGVRERMTTPIAGPSVDRRVFQYTSYVYNDHRIRSLICLSCAQIKLDTGRIRSDIEFRSGTWLFALPPGVRRKEM